MTAGKNQKPIVEIKGLVKDFGEHRVLDHIDFSVYPGEKVVVLGPSGSGKSTMLRCINALEDVSGGTIIVGGMEVTSPKTDINRLREHLGMVFQRFNLWPHKTVLENVMLAQMIVMKRGAAQAKEVALRLLDQVGLKERANDYPARLSGGQQQRVAIARALAAKPEIIYFDEPTSALDPQLKEEILVVMQGLAEEGMTMIVVTHEMAFAKNVSNKVLMMDGGVVIEARDAPSFFAEPREARSKAFLASFAEPKTAARPAGAEPRSTAS